MDSNFFNVLLLAGYVGVVNFLKVCTAPFTVGFLLYFFGITFSTKQEAKFWKVYKHVLWVSLGFVGMFIYKSLTFLKISEFVVTQTSILTRIGGLLLLAIAAYAAGLKSFSFFEKKYIWPLTSIFFGAVFALTWQPCSKFVIPFIQSMVAQSEKGPLILGLLLLPMVGIGIILPIIIFALPLSGLFAYLKNKPQSNKVLKVVACGLFIIMGILFVTGQIALFYTWAGQIVAPLITK